VELKGNVRALIGVDVAPQGRISFETIGTSTNRSDHVT
jgi:hypothetical protein